MQRHTGLASLVVALAFLAGHAATLRAQPLPADSPFGAAAAAPDAKAPSSGFTLLGMSVVGQTTLLGISRDSDRHSFWIPLGGTTSEITAVSYDAKAEQAVIRVAGQPLRLSMRHGAVVPAAPESPVPPPVAPAPAVSAATAPAEPAPPMTAQEEKEMEARMLVTDLLEIGQQQRKAYAAAQAAAARQAAAQKAAAPAPAAAPPPKK
ncbi:MAG TPA: hypothetical protein VHE13_10160 [Opitutus sp.]|nr:hypothetical protein [Opitutus sp.]